MAKLPQKILLPVGFRDVLPPFAAMESKTISKLLKTFELSGYEHVKPPMVEFEDSLISGYGKRLNKQTFRLLDPASRKMMGIRADMTLQIVRMASTRFDKEPRPLRLSYSGQVLRVKGEGLYAERQLAQVGAELIGTSAIEADAEIILLAITALARIDIKDLSIDFNMPRLPVMIMDHYQVSEEEREKFLDAIDKKDIPVLKAYRHPAADLLAALVHSAGSSEKVLKAAEKIAMPAEAAEYFTRLKKLLALISAAAPHVLLTIDPTERRGFDYQSGISFSIFSCDNASELGRGGRYRIGDAERSNAVGFTLSVNTLLRCLPKKKRKPRIYVPFGTPHKELKTLHKKGVITISGLEKETDITAEAKRLSCSGIYKKGEIEECK